jgi:diguanylate cyclase (GGDEF)-like protein/PAS domain S-box-containing protein
MSLAAVAGAAAGFLAAAIAAYRLWRGALRHASADRRPYLWFAVAAGLGFASMIVGLTVSLPADETAMVVTYADVPALLFLPAMAAGLAGLAGSAQGATAEAASARRSRRGRGIVGAYLLDGYVLAAALFLIGWVTLFGHVYTTSGADASTFAAGLLHPLADLLVLGACLPLAQAAGGRAVTPYLALVAMTVADSLAIAARAANTAPGAGTLTAQLAALVLLALTPWVSGVWPAAARWIGGAREVTTAAAATTAAVAGLLVLGQATASRQPLEPVEFFVLGGMAALLAIRVVSLVRRVDSWSRVWQESGRQFRQLAERTSDVVLLCDLDGVIKYASRAVNGYGYTPESLRGVTLADLLHPEDRAGGMRAVRRAIMGKAQRVGHYPCRVRAVDGTWRHVQSTVSLYVDPGQPDRLLVTARDMSAQVALRRQVTHLTFHDGLTGLPNRAYMEQRAQDVLGQVRQAPAAAGDGGQQIVPGVIVLGMDRFTAVNEECGHAAGDLLLAQIARRLRLAVSPQDTVARWGGDEFAVLTESAASAAELADIAERLSRSVAAQPFRIGETDLAITASVGVARADGSPAAHVWRNAEVALARAKLSGAGRVEVHEPGQAEPGGDDDGAAGTPGAGGPEAGGPADAVAGGPEAGGPADPVAGGPEAGGPADPGAAAPEARRPADPVTGAPEAGRLGGSGAGEPGTGELGSPGGGAGQPGVGPAVETIETAETPAGAGA